MSDNITEDMAPPYKIPRPHWLIFHPHLTLRDKIISAL
eukprot:CAMPEP_0172375376 /NCGR_PEP_ID=MMETSP1060-20121228/61452_1 /TAXON_ID=37318 /ORGANISM="Pseudo-nitzschia pungens, Strain cf. cingulata" /LENGTH=37 /DNA_ID= /DNA_START= /DNA_END= /DNA_ORIENTATION=